MEATPAGACPLPLHRPVVIMFEYAIGHQKTHPPSKPVAASWIVSCLGHAVLLLILLEYPPSWRGMNHG